MKTTLCQIVMLTFTLFVSNANAAVYNEAQLWQYKPIPKNSEASLFFKRAVGIFNSRRVVLIRDKDSHKKPYPAPPASVGLYSEAEPQTLPLGDMAKWRAQIEKRYEGRQLDFPDSNQELQKINGVYYYGARFEVTYDDPNMKHVVLIVMGVINHQLKTLIFEETPEFWDLYKEDLNGLFSHPELSLRK